MRGCEKLKLAGLTAKSAFIGGMLIQIYSVLLIGSPFLLERDGKKIEFGFSRNEYVFSHSIAKAVEIAKAKTLSKIDYKTIQKIDNRPIVLKVEQVKTGMPIWRLFRNEGFLFFPADASPT